MDVKHQQIIKENRHHLKNIDLEKLIQPLQEYKMFNKYMWEDIHSISDVLELLPTRGPKAFWNFIEILRKAGYYDEADVLEKPTLTLESADKFFYRMKSIPLGYCLIINNTKFETTKHECIQRSDVDAFKNFFTKAGFEVDVMNGLTSEEMRERIKNFSSSEDFTKVDSMILIIMSHGGHVNNKEVLYGIDGNYIDKDVIYDFFSNRNLGLQCKPKVFFFIAFRAKAKKSKESLDSENKVISSDAEVILADKTDMLIINTFPHCNLTGSHPKRGTYFCQVLVSVLNDHYKSCDLEDMIKLANQKLGAEFSETNEILNVIHSENTAWKKKIMLCRRN